MQHCEEPLCRWHGILSALLFSCVTLVLIVPIFYHVARGSQFVSAAVETLSDRCAHSHVPPDRDVLAAGSGNESDTDC